MPPEVDIKAENPAADESPLGPEKTDRFDFYRFHPGAPTPDTTPGNGQKDAKDGGDKAPRPAVAGGGESPAVRLYREKQGARSAGNGVAVADVVPPGPRGHRDGARPDVLPPDVLPPTPGPRPGPFPRPDIVPPAPPKPDLDVKPSPEVDRIPLKEKYETSEIGEALRVAREKGLPLVVHVGASWCGPCRVMEANVWPTVESQLKGKAVFLHLDAGQAERLRGDDARAAGRLINGVGGYPTIRVVNVDRTTGTLSVQASETGGKTIDKLYDFLARAGLER